MAKTLFKWEIDEPDSELYLAVIYDDSTVMFAYGRYAHSSGSGFVTWREFLAGEMNETVQSRMGEKILNEILARLKQLV